MADEQPAAKPKNPTSHKMYEISGDSIKSKKRLCPKCGPGTLLAAHKNRSTCGKCGYTEFASKEKKEEAPKEEKKE